MVLLPRLAEANARIEQNAAERHASARGEVEGALEETLDIIENVDRGIRAVAVVHGDEGGAGFRHGIRHIRIALKPPDVVDDASAEPRRLTRHRRLRSIDGDRGVQVGQRLEDRDHPLKLLPGRDGSMAGPGRFAANVDDPGTLGDHRPRARGGGLGLEMAATVRKRIRRHIENAHQHGRTSQVGEEFVASCGASVGGHAALLRWRRRTVIAGAATGERSHRRPVPQALTLRGRPGCAPRIGRPCGRTCARISRWASGSGRLRERSRPGGYPC